MSSRPTWALNYIDETYNAVSAEVEHWRGKLQKLTFNEDLTEEQQVQADAYLGHLLHAQHMIGRIGHIRLLVKHDLKKAVQRDEVGEDA